tara:strand:- start:648 stop:1022 length:375 start_codon:yes stop_codon:yes gene_type:complete
LQDSLLVSVGAILGANTRFFIYKKLEKNHHSRDYRILIINTFASFSLGIFLSILPRLNSYEFSYELVLFVLIGFFGSLSTFSSFVYELFDLFVSFKYLRAFKLYIISLALGIIALLFGFFVGNQ